MTSPSPGRGRTGAPQPGRTDPAIIRNFCIIAHIDHGKSTLADRMLQLTGVVDARSMRAQYLDRMDIERERGITIKSPGRRGCPGVRPATTTTYVLNMIDTPGHVDFTYEVSRSLAACEGAVLLVDAAQGIEAQTLANLYLAIDADLHIIPVLNKIDLPSAQPDKYAAELAGIIGCDPDDVLRVRAKTGEGVDGAAGRDRRADPGPPVGDRGRAGSCTDLRLGLRHLPRRGHLRPGRRRRAVAPRAGADDVDQGHPRGAGGRRHLARPAQGELARRRRGRLPDHRGEGGAAVPGRRHRHLAGAARHPDLGGYRHPNPMVYAGLYPIDGADYPELREALDKLQLNDAALVYEPETSGALGFGFRIGFLGLLHMEIVRERLEREFDLDLISTAPNVVYRVQMEDGRELTVTNPSEYPIDGKIAAVFEPTVKATILAPAEYIGTILELCQARRGIQRGLDYLSEDRVEIRYTLPLAEIVFDFFDALKSRTKGYASLDYEPSGEDAADLVKVDILLHGDPVDAFSAIVHKDKAYAYGLLMVGKLKELIPRQQFEVPIQAAIGSRVIARETIRAIRKDVLAKCYGGDITRKRKLIEKQKEGKKRMKMVGRVEVPQEAFVAALSTTEPAKADKK